MIEPKISLVIVNDDTADYLPKLFDTIKEQNGLESLFEVIFVDNCSKDNSVEIAKNFGVENVYVFEEKINKRGVLFQKGADLAKGDYVIFAHSDVYFGEVFFENLIKWLAENKDADFVNFGQYYVDGNFVNNHMSLDLPNKKIVYSGVFNELANNPFLDCSEGCFFVKKSIFSIYEISSRYQSNFYEFDLLKRVRDGRNKVSRCDTCKFFHYFLENREKIRDLQTDSNIFIRNNYDLFIVEDRLTDVATLSSVVSKKKEKIITLNEIINDKEVEIKNLNKVVSTKNRKIKELNEDAKKKYENTKRITDLEKKLDQKDSCISILNQQVSNLKNSFSYKLGRGLTFPIRILFPVGSRRECLLKIIIEFFSHPVKFFKQMSFREIKRLLKALSAENTSTVAKNISKFIIGDAYNYENEYLMNINLEPKKKGEKAILVIDQNVPLYDQDAGSRTMYQYLQLFVKNGYKVVFLCGDENEIPDYIASLEEFGVKVIHGAFSHRWQEFMLSNTEYFDYIFLNRAHVSINYIDFIKKNLKSKIIYNAVDFSYLRERRQYKITRDKVFLKAAKESKKREFYIFKNSDVVITISSFEKNILEKEFPNKKVFVIPTFIYEKLPLGANIDFNDRKNILFIGGFRHQPNVDGILWFVEEVMPILIEKIPGIVMNVAGSNPPKKILKLKSKNIKVLGFIKEEDLAKLYSNIRLVVAPLRYGAGVKGKVIEAIAYGVPVVTTKVGAEGIIYGDSLIKVCDNPDDFAKQVIDLYNDESKWSKTRTLELAYSEKFLSISNASDVIRKIFK